MFNDNYMDKIKSKLDGLLDITCAFHEITVEAPVAQIKSLLTQLRDDPDFEYDQLIDLCVVDYLLYGIYDWETESATHNGFSRGVIPQKDPINNMADKPRFAVVYHLLSTAHNQRIRVKAFLSEQEPIISSVIEVWQAANWFEREAYDLYGILFSDHPDLRRILTDYGFVGHPFRKDFPISGHVEMRYDATLCKVIYEPVDIEPRTIIPKVIRHDNRYFGEKSDD